MINAIGSSRVVAGHSIPLFGHGISLCIAEGCAICDCLLVFTPSLTNSVSLEQPSLNGWVVHLLAEWCAAVRWLPQVGDGFGDLMKKWFLFSLIWSVGGNLDTNRCTSRLRNPCDPVSDGNLG